jgi:acetyl esterase/lipase
MIQAFRAGNSAYMATLVGPVYDVWADQVNVTQVERTCRGRGCDSEGPWYFVTEPIDADDCGLIYYHGGSGLMLTAGESQWNVNRYATMTRCTVFNVDYRLAPEYNVVDGNSGIDDAWNAANDIADRVERGEFNVSADRLAYFGESGGAWITGGIGLRFAQNGGGHRFRF